MNVTVSRPLMLLIALICLSACLGFTENRAIGQQPADDLKKILADWQLRRDRTRTARYVMEGERLIPRGAFNGEHELHENPAPEAGDIPKQDHTSPVQLTLVIDSQGKRIRKEEREWVLRLGPGIFSPRYYVQVFSGESAKSYMPKSENENENYKRPDADADLAIIKKVKTVDLDCSDYPVLLSQGIVWPYPSELRGDSLHASRSLEGDLSIHGHGVLTGRECLILRSGGSGGAAKIQDELWVDPQRESAILRYERFEDGRLFWRVDTRYEQTSQGWLPEMWTYTLFKPESPDKFWFSETLRVKERVINATLSPTLFDFEMTAGMRVRISQTNDAGSDSRDYRVADDGHSLIPITGESPGSGLGRTVWWIQILAVSIVAMVLACWWVLRWRAKARQPKPGECAS